MRTHTPANDAVPGLSGPTFSADVDLDLTLLLKRLDEPQLVAEIIVALVAACRQERLIDDGSSLRVVRPTDAGLVGVQLAQAVNLSAYGISSGLKHLSSELPNTTASTLTVVDLSMTRIRVVGDWGLGGLGVATLGSVVHEVVPLSSGSGVSIAKRRVARLGLTAQGSQESARGVVRALDTVARCVEVQAGRDG